MEEDKSQDFFLICFFRSAAPDTSEGYDERLIQKYLWK